MSTSPRSTGPTTASSCAGSCCPSPSTRTARSKPFSYAYRKPVCTEPPIPRLKGRRNTCAPCILATSDVLSIEPSSITTISKPGSKASSSSITWPIAPSSFSAGTIAMRRRSATGRNGLEQPGELEHAASAVRVRVLVECPFARAASELLGLWGFAEQGAVLSEFFVRVRHDEQLKAGRELTISPLVRSCVYSCAEPYLLE